MSACNDVYFFGHDWEWVHKAPSGSSSVFLRLLEVTAALVEAVTSMTISPMHAPSPRALILRFILFVDRRADMDLHPPARREQAPQRGCSRRRGWRHGSAHRYAINPFAA